MAADGENVSDAQVAHDSPAAEEKVEAVPA